MPQNFIVFNKLFNKAKKLDKWNEGSVQLYVDHEI